MKKNISARAYIILIILSFSAASCSLFKKTQTVSPPATTAPTPTTQAPAPEQKNEENKTANIPFNVPEFGRLVQKPVYHIALFSPLYIDSAVDRSGNFPGNSLPSYMLPGLEFYEGAQLAMDSLATQGYNLQVSVFDTKSATHTVKDVLNSTAMDSTDLIIGALNLEELQEISSFSKTHRINFVSATYPNDGGIRDNPFLVIVNSTLQAHCSAIISYALKNFGNMSLTVFRKSNAQENIISDYLKTAYKNAGGDKITPLREVMYDTTWTPDDLAKHLVQSKNNVCVLTALDNSTAVNIAQKLAVISKSYQLNLMGMPTWDGIRDFYSGSYNNLAIFYSTPYYNDKKDAISRHLMDAFTHLYNLPSPSDMAFKGFDITWYFLRLLKEHGLYFNANLNDRRAYGIVNYSFQPVYDNRLDKQPDYFENTHLYFIKIFQGNAYSAGSN